MLPRYFRLKKESDFRRIYQKGRKIRGNFFDITYLVNLHGPRFGIVVTTKTINKSSHRNQNKRLMRALVLKEKEHWPKNFDLIVKIKKEIIEEKEKTRQELQGVFARIKNVQQNNKSH